MKNLFEEKHWELITDILNNGKNTTWFEIAEKYNIRPEGDKTQRSKSANDIWRRFLRVLERKNLDLKVVKQTLNEKGEVIFETRKKSYETEEYPKNGFTVGKITTNPYGGEWVTYEKEKEEIIQNVLKAIDSITEKYSGKVIKKHEKNRDEEVTHKLAVVNLYDAHLDKLPLKSTCGYNSTIVNNCNLFLNAVEKIVDKLEEEKIETIIFPVGNDLFHTNAMNRKTKKGTELEYFGSPEENYYVICDVIIEAIMKLASVCNNLQILMIKGNHDQDKISVLGYWLNTIFSRCEGIEVDYNRTQRKYIQYGENLIGFAHGDKEKKKMSQLPLIVASEAKEIWGNTTYRKMYLGDLHHGFEYQFLKAKDQPGMEVEYLRSVGTADTWHQDHGWVGIPKTAYVQLFDKKEGEVARFKFNI